MKPRLIPKILIACPTSERHGHIIDEWIKHLDSLTYPDFDVCLVDNTLDTDRYFNKIKEFKVKDKPVISWRHEWDVKELNHLQMLAHVREEIRKYFIENNYDFLLFLDDDIFIPDNGIQTLVSYYKDQVGFYVHVFYEPDTKPCLLKSGEIIMGKGLEYFSFAEVDAYKDFVKRFKENKLTKKEKLLIPHIIKDKQFPNLFKTYGVNLGCLLIKKEVLEKCQFRTHPTFIWGEDLWYYAEANDKRFEFWVDTDVRAIHKNTDWEIIKESPKQMGFAVMHGPVDSNNFDVVKYSEDKK